MNPRTKRKLQDAWAGVVVGTILSMIIMALIAWRSGAL